MHPLHVDRRHRPVQRLGASLLDRVPELLVAGHVRVDRARPNVGGTRSRPQLHAATRRRQKRLAPQPRPHVGSSNPLRLLHVLNQLRVDQAVRQHAQRSDDPSREPRVVPVAVTTTRVRQHGADDATVGPRDQSVSSG